MKCPKCDLLTSDSRDECPRCKLDLRPLKERLGIKSDGASKPRQKKILTQGNAAKTPPAPTEKPKEKGEKEQEKRRGFFGSLFGFGKKSEEQPAPEAAPASQAADAPETAPRPERESERPAAARPHAEPVVHIGRPAPKPRKQQATGDLSDFIAALEQIRNPQQAKAAPTKTAAAKESLDERVMNDLIEALQQMAPEAEQPEPSEPTIEATGDGIDGALDDLLAALEASDEENAGPNEMGAADLFAEDEPLQEEETDFSALGEAIDALSDQLLSADFDAPMFAGGSAGDSGVSTAPAQEDHALAADQPSSPEEDDDELLFPDLTLRPDASMERGAGMFAEDTVLQAMEETLETAVAEAKDATASLQLFDFPADGAAADDELEDESDDGLLYGVLDSELSAEDAAADEVEEELSGSGSLPEVAPEVMEFDDDDELLEQKLDEIIGDLELNIEAVKEAKKPKPSPQNDAVFLVDDDLEISFEIEMDDPEDHSVQNTAPGTSASVEDSEEAMLEGLLSSLEELEKNTERRSIVAEQSAASEESDALLGELTELLSAGDPERTIADPTDPLLSLEDELEKELGLLAAEGTTFLRNEASPLSSEEPTLPEEAAPEEIAEPALEDPELAALEAELNEELSLLEEEGLTFHRELDTDAAPVSAAPAVEAAPTEPQIDEEPEPIHNASEFEELISAVVETDSSAEEFEAAEAADAVEPEDSTGLFAGEAIFAAEELSETDFNEAAAQGDEEPSEDFSAELSELTDALDEMLASGELGAAPMVEEALSEPTAQAAEVDSFEEYTPPDEELQEPSEYQNELEALLQEAAALEQEEASQQLNAGSDTDIDSASFEEDFADLSEDLDALLGKSSSNLSDNESGNKPAAVEPPPANENAIPSLATPAFQLGLDDLLPFKAPQAEATEAEDTELSAEDLSALEEIAESLEALVAVEEPAVTHTDSAPDEAVEYDRSPEASGAVEPTPSADVDCRFAPHLQLDLDSPVEEEEDADGVVMLEDHVEGKTDELHREELSAESAAFEANDAWGDMSHPEATSEESNQQTFTDALIDTSDHQELSDDDALDEEALADLAEAFGSLVEQEDSEGLFDEPIQEDPTQEDRILENPAQEEGLHTLETQEEVQEEVIEASTPDPLSPTDEGTSEAPAALETSLTGAFLAADFAEIFESAEEPLQDSAEESIGEVPTDDSEEGDDEQHPALLADAEEASAFQAEEVRHELTSELSEPDLEAEALVPHEAADHEAADHEAADKAEHEEPAVQEASSAAQDDDGFVPDEFPHIAETAQVDASPDAQEITEVRFGESNVVESVSEEAPLEAAEETEQPQVDAFDEAVEAAEEQSTAASVEESADEEPPTEEFQVPAGLADAVSTGMFLVNDLAGVVEHDAEATERTEAESTAEEEPVEAGSSAAAAALGSESAESEEIELRDLFSLFQDEISPSSNAAPLESAVATGVFLASDLQKIIDSGTREAIRAPLAAEIEVTLWEGAEAELTVEAQQRASVEISFGEICRFSQNETSTLLFDLAEAEIRNPGGIKSYIKAIPTSEERTLDNSHLEKAVLRFERDQRILNEIQREAALQPPQEDTIPVAPAPRWRRAFAGVLDLTAVALVTAGFAWMMIIPDPLLQQLAMGTMPELLELLPYLFDLGLAYLGAWLLLNTALLGSTGQTSGMRLLNIEARNMRGGPLSVLQALVRSMAQTTVLLTLGLSLLPALGRSRRTLHDYLARTQVGRKVEPVIEEIEFTRGEPTVYEL